MSISARPANMSRPLVTPLPAWRFLPTVPVDVEERLCSNRRIHILTATSDPSISICALDGRAVPHHDILGRESGMGMSKAVSIFGCALILVGLVYAQRPFREYPSVEYGYAPIPSDAQQKAEWTFARLMYPPGPNAGYRGRFDGDWRQGLSLWTQDYPRADRAFAAALRRLTRVQSRSVEESVSLEDGGEVYNWPWLYAVQVGEWGLTPEQGKVLRDYLLHGGFFMADDFHGAEEFEVFVQRMKYVFPDRPLVDIPDNDPIFHTVFDLNERYRVTG